MFCKIAALHNDDDDDDAYISFCHFLCQTGKYTIASCDGCWRILKISLFFSYSRLILLIIILHIKCTNFMIKKLSLMIKLI